MQSTSETWKQLWAGGARLEARARINGVEYTAMSNPVIARALTQSGMGVGNAVSATCQFSVVADREIPRAAEVRIQMRLTDGETASEWLPAGTFYIARRQKDPVTGIVTLVCYDAMLKANAMMAGGAGGVWTTDAGDTVATEGGSAIRFAGIFPCGGAEAAAAIANMLGVALDSRCSFKTGAAYAIDGPRAGETIHDLLGRIAAANGGNWIITPAGKLRLVSLVSSSGAAEAQSDVIDVAGVTGSIGERTTGTVTGIRYPAGDSSVVLGDESGIVIDANVGAAVAWDLYDELPGTTYQSFSLEGALYDPAAELGDYVRAGANGEVASVLYSETATLGALFSGSISAPEGGELADEYPYIGQSQKTLTAARAYTTEVVGALDDALDQEEIFNRLTDNGAAQGIYLADGQLYVSASYIQSGTMSAARIKGGKLTLGGSGNINGELEILNAGGNVIGEWNKDGFNVSAGEINLVNADSLGTVAVLIASSGTHTMQVVRRSNYSGGINGTTVFGGDSVTITDDNTGMKTVIRGHQWRMSDANDTTIIAATYNNGALGFGVQGTFSASGDISTGEDLSVTGNGYILGNLRVDDYLTGGTGGLSINSATHIHSSLDVDSSLDVTGSLTVSGVKSRAVDTDQYATRLLYCYETPSPMFGDIGEGVIGADGRCYVALDAVFAQTVGAGRYQVFAQAYGGGECRVIERAGAWFVVEGTPGTAFGWEIKAKQRGYEQLRLERDEEPFSASVYDYGGDAARHIEELNRGRTAA